MIRPCWVRVPASTSNLGPGFDVLGMALDLFLEARFVPGGRGFRVERHGALATLDLPPEEDLVVRAMLQVMVAKPQGSIELDDVMPGGVLTLDSPIPVGRGLGSSAAARVAGHALGGLLTGREPERDGLVEAAALGEGHPDNAAPAVLGGLVAARMDPSGRVRAVPLPVSHRLGWVYAAPEATLDTKRSRAALPRQVDHAAAVRNAGRLAMLLPALASGDGPALAEAMEDELHVPYRLPLIPGGEAAVRAGRGTGAWAVTLSGAGSGLVAVTPPGVEESVGQAMAQAFREAEGSGGGLHRVVRPWLPGIAWGWGEPTPPGPRRFATSPG